MSVGTNNAAGYVLTMSATDSDLVNVADSTKTIPTLATKTGGYTDADFTTNAWGYKNGITNNYFPFNASGATILSSSTRTNNDSTTLRFAAKVDYTKPSGLYEQELNFTITANMATYYMQDLDPVMCTEEPIEAIDIRDNNTYWVAKLADGNCWMLNNLQLGNKLADVSGTMTLTPANSNISQNWELTNKVADGKMPYTTISNDDVDGNAAYVEKDSDHGGKAFYCTTGDSEYKSCYYNWFTATAGSGTKEITGKDTTGVDVNESICPRGWVIPKGGSDSNTNNFAILNSYYLTPADMLVNPNTALDNINGASKPGFLFSGLVGSSSPSYIGSNGYYWSRTAYSTGRAYDLYITDSTVYPQNHPNKFNGMAVRCLRETRKIGDIENMQDISPAIVANTNKESSTTLKDTRDNQEYTVAKLKDGKVWMTQNLRLGTNVSSVTITPSNSNVSSNFTLNLDSDGKFPYTTINPDDRYSSATHISGIPSVSAYYCSPVSGNNYVGCYYNWYTATAGADGNEQITPVGNGTGLGYVDVSSSICPKGWYLPSGGGEPLTGSTSDRPNSDFNVLYNNYPSATDMLVSSPTTTYNNTSGQPRPGLLLSGLYHTGGALNVGSLGVYWSRSAYSKGMAYDLYLNSSVVYPQNYAIKYDGFSVRCLAY